jgi:hypothetical protein
MYDYLIMGRAIIFEWKIKDNKFLNCYVGQYLIPFSESTMFNVLFIK